MKSKFTTLVVLLAMIFGTNTMKAQSFTTGTTLFSAGYGFGNLTKSLFNIYDNNTAFSTGAFGPVFLKGEYGISDNIGFGLNIAYLGITTTFKHQDYDDNMNLQTYNDKITYTGYSILPRINFHFANTDKLDPFFGFGFGYRDATYTYTSNDPDYSFERLKAPIHLGFEITLGIRYYVSENIGFYAEVGGAKAVAQLGLSLKL